MRTLNVNGVDYQVDVPDDVPLLWVIREEIGLTGTKFGCGAALCGVRGLGRAFRLPRVLGPPPP